MKKISVYRPTSIEEAIRILSLHGTDAGVYAGGTDLLIRLKNRLKQAPTYLVDVKKIGNLRYIKETTQGGVQIGALTKLAEIAESDLLAKKYPMLVQAVKMISSPELRNASTLGGDLLQEVLASASLGLQLRDKTIEDARVVFGGIAGRPWRERSVEEFLKGKTLTTELAAEAPSNALGNAAPLKYNATKIDMAKGLLASGLTKLAPV